MRRLRQATRIKAAVEEFLRYIEILAWDSAAAHQYAEIRTLLEESGRPMENLDLMIAAHALSIGAVLVTGDRVFRRVEELKTEDWGHPG